MFQTPKDPTMPSKPTINPLPARATSSSANAIEVAPVPTAPVLLRTFPELLVHIETRLKMGEYFEMLTIPGKPREFAPLLSLKLQEVYFQENGARGVTFLVEGVFQSKYAPHRFEASSKLKAELGLADVALGMGCGQNPDGTSTKGLTMTIAKDWLVELEQTRLLPKVNAAKSSLKRAKQSRRAVELSAELDYLDKEAKRIARQRTATMAKLARLADKAAAAG
jgi:hypothetical protein